MRRIRITVGVGLAAIALALIVVLSGSPIAVAGKNFTQTAALGEFEKTTEACQANETLPRGTSSVRLRAFAFTGPRVTVKILEAGHVIASGEQSSGWTGGVVTVPVAPLATVRSGVTLCFAYFLNDYETMFPVGQVTSPANAARGHGVVLPGRLGVEYLRPSSSSWWSRMLQVARHMGLGNAWGGTWCVGLVLLVMAGVVLLVSRAALRELQ